MWEPSNEATLGVGLSLLADALHEKNALKLTNAAKLFETICDQAYVSNRSEPILRTISAFAFEASGESPRSQRSYHKLFNMTLPLEKTLESKELSKILTQAIAHYGLRDLDGFRILAQELFDDLNKRQVHTRFALEPTAKTDYLLSLGIVNLLLCYSEALGREKKLTPLIAQIESLDDIAEKEFASSWLAILTHLVCYTLGSVVERSVLNLNLQRHIESELIKRGITELWIPQAEAVSKGLLSGRNLVYSTGTATGKSLLAYLLAGTASAENKVAYIVPTRTLANEAFKTIVDLVDPDQIPVAISTREKTEFDEELSGYAIIIATYEKFHSLLKQKKINEANLKCLVADEVHFISDRDRGIPLEFTLTDVKSKAGADDPQVVVLSAMISSEDANLMSSWLQASLVRTEWRPVNLDEMIIYNGNYHHKDGVVEEAHPPFRLLSSDEPTLRQRVVIAARLARDRIVKEGQCMIIVPSRRDAEKVAEEISRHLDASRFFDLDSTAQLSINAMEREKLRQEIQRSEPELPVCAKRLVNTIGNGVGYHHAGLPAKYREIIESAVRKQLVKVLVTTTTFEVGVNLPIGTVIFLQANERSMPVRTYRNLAGRAGRPKFDTKGESVIIALTKEEFEKARDTYFLSQEEPLESGIQYFMRQQPVARYAIQSEILETASRQGAVNFQDLISFMKKSWFWARANDQTREEFINRVRTEVRKLRVFGFVETRGDSIELTDSGKVAGKMMLSPYSVRNMIDNARRILEGKFDKESQEILLLSLVGIPHEVEGNDEIIDHVKVSNRCEFVSQVLSQDPALYEKLDRTELCPKYATVLWYWVNSIAAEEIMRFSNLDPSSDSALLEEMLPNDAYWVLQTLASIPHSVLRMTKEQRETVTKLALACKSGSLDPMVQDILNLELKHMGRNTAIKLARFMREKNRDLKQLTESDLCELFPSNLESAKLLSAELEAQKNVESKSG